MVDAAKKLTEGGKHKRTQSRSNSMSYGGYGAGGYNNGGGHTNNYGNRGSSASYSSRSAGRAAPPKKHMLKLIILGDSG